jgi:hypothetical protein
MQATEIRPKAEILLNLTHGCTVEARPLLLRALSRASMEHRSRTQKRPYYGSVLLEQSLPYVQHGKQRDVRQAYLRLSLEGLGIGHTATEAGGQSCVCSRSDAGRPAAAVARHACMPVQATACSPAGGGATSRSIHRRPVTSMKLRPGVRLHAIRARFAR